MREGRQGGREAGGCDRFPPLVDCHWPWPSVPRWYFLAACYSSCFGWPSPSSRHGNITAVCEASPGVHPRGSPVDSRGREREGQRRLMHIQVAFSSVAFNSQRAAGSAAGARVIHHEGRVACSVSAEAEMELCICQCCHRLSSSYWGGYGGHHGRHGHHHHPPSRPSSHRKPRLPPSLPPRRQPSLSRC